MKAFTLSNADLARSAHHRDLRDIAHIHQITYDTVAEEYRQRGCVKENQKQLEEMLTHISRHISRGYRKTRVLELGPGAGYATRLLSDTLDDVTAIELSPKMCELVRKSTPRTRLIQSDFLRYNFQGQTYSCVLAIGFVHLFPSWCTSTVLQKIRALLAPGGIAYISTTLHDVAQEGYFPKSDYFAAPVRYRRYFTKPSIEYTLHSSGLRLLSYCLTQDPLWVGKMWISYIVDKL